MAPIRAGIDGRLFLQKFLGCLEPFLGYGKVFHKLGRELPGIVRMSCRLAFSIHIQCQGSIPKLGKHVCPFTGIVVQTPPLMNYQDPRSFALYGIIVSQVALHQHALRRIFHCFSGNLCFGRCRAGNSEHDNDTE